MTGVHEIVGISASVECLPMSHVCDIDLEMCCEYWVGMKQAECIYYKEGAHDVQKVYSRSN
jgi:hypothetical protein